MFIHYPIQSPAPARSQPASSSRELSCSLVGPIREWGGRFGAQIAGSGGAGTEGGM
jgi:hypothetical protein